MDISRECLTSPEFLVFLTLAIPLAGAFLAAVIKRPNVRDGAVVFVSAMLFLHILVNIYGNFNWQGSLGDFGIAEITLWEVLPNLSISFAIDPFGMIFLFVASFLWIVTSIYSIGYMRGNKEANQSRFYCFFALAIFGTMGLAFASNLFTLFVFYEFLTLSTFPLVTHSGTPEAMRSGRRYLGTLLVTSIFFFLPAMIWTFVATGTLQFTAGGILSGHVGPIVTGILLFLFMFGIGKAALMPFHGWLPAAMVAPTPVSALLHAVAVVKAGVFTVLKVVVYIFGIDHLNEMIAENWWAGGWLMYVAGATIIIASFIALRQDNLKKRLAFSTISQLSYIVLAVAIFSPKAAIAGAFHIAAHAVSKITLFFAAGAIYTASKKKNISQLNGIGKRMPITMACFTIGALSMIGLPPAVGFLTKFYIMMGAFESQHYFAIAVLLLSTVLNAAYFLPIIFAAYFKDEDENTKDHGEAPLPILIAITVTAFLTLALFFYPDIFLGLSKLGVML